MTTELDLPLKMTEVHAKEICMWLNQTLSELKKLPPLEQTTKGPFAWGVCEEPPSNSVTDIDDLKALLTGLTTYLNQVKARLGEAA
ncbi:MAG: hypothetical protein ACM36C_09660 [Acidobacteriota bacterium]